MIEPDTTPNQPLESNAGAPRRLHAMARYLQSRKPILRDRALTVLATLLVLLISLAAWRYYSQWRLGRIVLTNHGIPLLAQLLPESGDEPLDEPFDVVARSTLSLPAGDYRLRVNGAGRLGRTYRFAVNQGETITHEVSLDEERLLAGRGDPSNWSPAESPRQEPIPFVPVTTALELMPGRFDIVELTGQAVLRRGAGTGEPVWNTAKPKTPYAPARDPGPWFNRFGENGWGLHVIEPAIDCDGDGTRDVIVASPGSPRAFIALSGDDGSMLWNFAAKVDGPGGPLAESPGSAHQMKPAFRPGHLIGLPATGDVDGDGTPDLITTLVFHETPAEVQQRIKKPPSPTTPAFSRRIIVAISGRSGRSLWTFPLDPTFAHIIVQYWDKPAALVRGKRSAQVAILDGSSLTLLDPATGQPRSAPFDLGFGPVRPLQYADLTGDGEPELLALGQGASPQQQSLTACSLDTGKALWTVPIAARYPLPNEMPLRPEWPWLIDLDRDGQTEVIVPDTGPIPPKAAFRGLRVLAGTSGQTRWVRSMQPDTKAEDGLDKLEVAPDLDGDGVRDLITVSRFDGRFPPASRSDPRTEPQHIYADALSGRDGHPLWHWHVALPENKYTAIRPPHWWGRGPDGWPLLAVPLGGPEPGREFAPYNSYFNSPVVHNLEASTGRELHQAMGLTRIGTADLDGDGLLDLWGSSDGELRCIRGNPPEAWRAFGPFRPATTANFTLGPNSGSEPADLDGDGIADTVSNGLYITGPSLSGPTGSRTAIARSGFDGHVLWKTVLDPPWLWFLPEPGRSYTLAAFPLPLGDFNGDGTPDIVVQKNTNDQAAIGRQPACVPLQLLSGRDGRQLWTAGPLPLGFEAHGFSQVSWFGPCAVEASVSPDLLVLHRSPFVKATATTKPAPISAWAPSRQRLARVSGHTGRVVWDIPLEEQPSSPSPGFAQPGPPTLDDLDGDGTLDAAVVIRRSVQPGQADFELKVISLHDAVIRWSRLIHYDGSSFGYPAVVIGKGAPNEPATLFVEESPGTNTSNELLVHALSGRDGSERWTWRTGTREGDRRVFGGIDGIALDHAGVDAVCVTYSDHRRECHIVILDANGTERGRRTLPPEPKPTNYFPPVGDYMIDLDGDGRDELIVWNDNKLSAWGSDLKDRWSFPTDDMSILRVLRPYPGRPSTLILPPSRAIDGMTGELRWIHKPFPLASRNGGELLDPGNSTRLPRLIFARNNSSGTICRNALPATPKGDYLPPSGAKPPPGLARDDPRWTRGLPWTNLMTPQTARTGLLAVLGLALLNVFVPLSLLWLAARRRPWSLRVLMALPVAAAVPLTAFQAVEPLLPVPPPSAPLPSSPLALFALGSAAGVPLLAFLLVVGVTLLRKRWRTLIFLTGFTLLASFTMAAIWLWFDMRSMPPIEHYSRSGSELALVPGACVASVLMVVIWLTRQSTRWITRRATRSPCSRHNPVCRRDALPNPPKWQIPLAPRRDFVVRTPLRPILALRSAKGPHSLPPPERPIVAFRSARVRLCSEHVSKPSPAASRRVTDTPHADQRSHLKSNSPPNPSSNSEKRM